MTKLLNGPSNSITDIDGFLVGNAHDSKLKSGVTVLTRSTSFRASVSILGGAPGTKETDLLSPDKIVDNIDGIVLSGGSAFGLDASSGVMDCLKNRNRGFDTGSIKVPIVPSAILFDLKNGGFKDWKINPYRDLGQNAFLNVSEKFEIGSVGAGCGATTSVVKGGLGTASFFYGDRVKVGAIVAVNSVGSPCFPGTNILYSDFYGANKKHLEKPPASSLINSTKLLKGEATTLGIVCTNLNFNKSDLNRIATAAHSGIARAIEPSHTPFDGDIIFSATSGTQPIDSKDKDLMLVCQLSALCITQAIGSAIKAARKKRGDKLACWADIKT
jgi:L-aminopeptidase/D-esterase-like protein